jgi:hypothetical protein
LNDGKEIKMMVGILENPTNDVYDNTKPCQYCGRCQWDCDNLLFGPHTLVYFDRGRKRHWVRTCRDCANAKQQFRGPAPHTKIPSLSQKINAWYAVFDVVIEQQGSNNYYLFFVSEYLILSASYSSALVRVQLCCRIAVDERILLLFALLFPAS